MNEKQVIKALNIFKGLNKEQMEVFLFAAKTYFQRFDDNNEEDDIEKNSIDDLKESLDLVSGDLAKTLNMIRKVYFGEAKMVYGVYADDTISFEDNDGEFLW